MVKKALYLAGGGARGAYQVGVLKAINQILQVKTLPFNTVSGVSVGSINALVLAEYADDFPQAVEKLESLWGEIECNQLYKASNYELGKSVMRNLSTLIMKQRQSGFLLDTSPLHELIKNNSDFKRIEKNIQNNHLDFLEIISLCYENQQTISFYSTNQPDFQDWHYPRHKSQNCIINEKHILASTALPLFFPTVDIDGFHFGDGSMGLSSPLRGAIRFEVDKVLIIGSRELPGFISPELIPTMDIPFAHILGNMLNAVFLDNLDRDIEMVNRMNEIATLMSIWKKHRSTWRSINTLYLRPSFNISTIAQIHYKTMPALLRYLLNILGAKNHSGDLASFLLFEKEFARELINLGYKDTMASASQLTDFFK